MIVPVPASLSFTSIETFRLQRNTAILRSRFTGQGQRLLYPFAVWVFKGRLRDYAPEDAVAIRAFLISLKGQSNSFRLPVPGYSVPSTGMVDNNIITNGNINPRDTTANFKSMNPNALILRAGDYFTINDELKVATADLIADGLGNGAVTFEPPMRKLTGAANALSERTMIINNPTVLLTADDDDVADWKIKPPLVHGFTLNCIEAVDI